MRHGEAGHGPDQRAQVRDQHDQRSDEQEMVEAEQDMLDAELGIAGGYAHFKFASFVIDYIPAYIPFHVFWTYFCGICLFAGGIGLLIPPLSKWAALFSGIMLSGWFVLLHIPRFIANMNDASDRMGLFESFTLAGIFFTLAGVLSGVKSLKV